MKRPLVFALALAAILAAGTAGCAARAKDKGLGDQSGGPFRLTSPAFADQGTIPAKCTCDNGDVPDGISPALSWANPPDGAGGFALTVEDLDAGDAAHWGLIDLLPIENSLVEDASPRGPLPPDAWQTLNYKGGLGYAGPCPPSGAGAHRYVFTLWALDAPVGPPAIEKPLADVLPDLQAHAVATTTLTGLYGRP